MKITLYCLHKALRYTLTIKSNIFFQLLYFSAASHAQEGFMRALSVASGTHMPRLPKTVFKTESIPNRYNPVFFYMHVIS